MNVSGIVLWIVIGSVVLSFLAWATYRLARAAYFRLIARMEIAEAPEERIATYPLT